MIWKEGTGPRPWRSRLQLRGRDTQRSFATKKAAEAYERDEQERYAREQAGLPPEQGPISYDDLAQMFLDGYSGASKTWMRQMLAHSRSRFGTVTVRHLRGEDIGRWLHGDDLAHLSPATRLSILKVMRQVLNAGVEWGYVTRSPARAVKPPKRVKSTVYPLQSWAEVLAVANAAGHYSPLIRFACLTGLRPGEWAALRWGDIDIPNHVLHITGTLSGQGVAKRPGSLRAVTLAKPAIEALQELARPLDSLALVFTRPDGKAMTPAFFNTAVWKPALAEAGLAIRPGYQTRHTFATLALQQGVSIEWISKQMGHADIATTLRHYARFTKPVDDRMRALLNQIGVKDDESDQGLIRDQS